VGLLIILLILVIEHSHDEIKLLFLRTVG
jgi:hypothetical protein